MSELFFKVYRWMADLGLLGNDLIIYAFLYTMEIEMKKEVFGQSYISEATGIPIRLVRRSMKRLIDDGFIRKVPQKFAFQPCIYSIDQNGQTCVTKMVKQYDQNGQTVRPKRSNVSDQNGQTLLLIGKKNNIRENIRDIHKKSEVANFHSLEEISAETLVSLSLPSDPELMESILGFIDHRKKMKKPLTERALTLNIRKAHKLSDGKAERMTELFNLAVERGWQGIYPESNQKGGAKNDNNDDEPFFK